MIIIKITSLASGSKGNVTLVETNKYNILIDCGLSGKKINELLLINNGIDLDDIDLVLITHTHSDHIMSFNKLYTNYKNIKFVVNKRLKREIEEVKKKQYDDNRFIFIDDYKTGETINIGNFELQHDAYCLGWVIEEVNGESICFISDNGEYPYKLLENDILKRPYTYYLIESNYDKFSQYIDTTRNELLKRRVLSTKGHSDNFNAIEKAVRLLEESENTICKGIMFTHLSEHCNNEDLASESHKAYIEVWGKKTLLKNVEILYAKQDDVTKFKE